MFEICIDVIPVNIKMVLNIISYLEIGTAILTTMTLFIAIFEKVFLSSLWINDQKDYLRITPSDLGHI